MDAFELDQQMEAALRRMPAELRPWLLEVLTSPDEKRVRAIGELYASGQVPQLVELLVDLEEDSAGEQVRAMMVGYLSQLEGG